MTNPNIQRKRTKIFIKNTITIEKRINLILEIIKTLHIKTKRNSSKRILKIIKEDDFLNYDFDKIKLNINVGFDVKFLIKVELVIFLS